MENLSVLAAVLHGLRFVGRVLKARQDDEVFVVVVGRESLILAQRDCIDFVFVKFNPTALNEQASVKEVVKVHHLEAILHIASY